MIPGRVRVGTGWLKVGTGRLHSTRKHASTNTHTHTHKHTHTHSSHHVDALVDNIRVSVVIDSSIAPTNPLLTVTKVKVAVPHLNISFSNRKYLAISGVLGALAASPNKASTPASPAGPAAAHHGGQAVQSDDLTRGTSSRPVRVEGWAADSADGGEGLGGEGETCAPAGHESAVRDGVGAGAGTGAGVGLRDWKVLDVCVYVAPSHAISLVLSDEDTLVKKDQAAASRREAVPIASLSVTNVTLAYICFADQTSSIEVNVGAIEALDTRPQSANCFRTLISSPNPLPRPAGGMAGGVRRLKHPRSNRVVMQVKIVADPEGSECVVWLGHLQVYLQ